jgi:hypothetical protein
MSFELIGIIALAVLGVAMYMKHRAKPVDMDHKAPNVHNVQMKGKVGPATAADKPAPKAAAKKPAAPKKKVVKKKTTKKKTTKKTSTKK